MGKENAFYIDDNPDPTAIYDSNKFNPFEKETDDPVCAISANESQLFIVKKNNNLFKKKFKKGKNEWINSQILTTINSIRK